MIKLTNQKKILDEMDEEDRRYKTYVMFTSLAYPTMWLWLFVAASYKLASFGHPLWGLVVLLATLPGVARYILLEARTIVATQEYLRQLHEREGEG